MKRTNTLIALLALFLALQGTLGCAPKEATTEEGPDRIEIDKGFLQEALGDEAGEGSQLSREEILKRKEEREAAQQKAAEVEQAAAKQDAAAEVGERKRARGSDPDYGKLQTYCKRCGFLLDENNLEGALKEAQALVAARPTAPDGHVVLGIVYRKMGKLEEAIKEYEEALSREPDDEWGVANLGIAYRHSGKFSKAAALYEGFLQRNPKSALVHYNAGILYEVYIGDPVNALKHYMEYLNVGGDRQQEVNSWITVLASDLDLERPMTPGYKPPEEYEAPPSEGQAPAEGSEAQPRQEEGQGGGAAPAAATPAATADATQAAVAPAAAAPAPAQSAPPVALVPVKVVLYPIQVTKGEVAPDVLAKANEVFAAAFSKGGNLVDPAAVAQAAQAKGKLSNCNDVQCQLDVTKAAGGEALVHTEMAGAPDAWYVISDYYNPVTNEKLRFKAKVLQSKGADALAAELEKMAGQIQAKAVKKP